MSAKLHLMKLCVGAEGPADLAAWQASHFGRAPALHVTRMWPKRDAELLEGGSIYWVFKGVILARQRILALEPVEGGDGVRRCGLVLDRALVPVAAVPRRPFQGWRYLEDKDAPRDLAEGEASGDALPLKLASELARLGLV